MGVMDLVALGLRAAQFVFAVISLGLDGYSEEHLSQPQTSIITDISAPRQQVKTRT